MIKYRQINVRGEPSEDWQNLTPTVFPDKTTQIWKLKKTHHFAEVLWEYESDAELIQVAQVCDLFFVKKLIIPFFPYARQDKEINNENTFGLHTFLKLLSTVGTQKIETFDVHNAFPIQYALKDRFVNILPYQMVEIAQDIKPDAIFFPDKGAADRYGQMFKEMKTFHFNKVPHLFGDKVRNQQTGEIIGYEVQETTANSVLICDDLCDGGATFINAAKKLKEQGVKNISLYVSHGLFTKGTKVLFDNGIDHIYTKDGKVTVIT